MQPLGRYFQTARWRGRRALLLLITFVAIPLWAVACGDDERPPAPPSTASSGSSGGQTTMPCTDGDEQDCHIEIGRNNGVLTCYSGTQMCTDGEWGPCAGGEVTSKASGKIKGQAALSLPAACINNPCDPTCQFYDEVPTQTIIDNSIEVFGWNTGNDDSPSPLATTFPCSDGADCQSNHYCQSPLTDPSCGHSKCETGSPLLNGCDTCVDRICAADADCCTQPVTCDGWVGGAPGYTLCGETPTSCNFYMTNTTQSCNDYCATMGGSCVNGLEPFGACGASFTVIGCGGTGNPGVLCSCTKPAAGNWDNDCVDMVKTECNSFCATPNPPDPIDETGQCTQWQPGASDLTCSGYNLTVGITCDNNVPVCNVGDATVPAGVEIAYYPPGSGELGNCTPSTPPSGNCVTADPIPPGQCVDVNCGALAADTEIMVNPPGAMNVTECNPGACLDNWSVHTPGMCIPPVCKGTESITNFTRVNMFVMVDKSGSMGSYGMWTPAMNAFQQFFADPGSNGLNVALRFFPSDLPTTGCSWSTCDAAACADPLVDLGTLTDDPAPTDTHEANLISAIAANAPGGGTPTYPALSGALQWATDFAAGHPDETTLVVIVTDGDPTQCNTSSTAIVQLAADALSTAGVLTYAVGLDGANQTLMDNIAAAGGTEQAFFVSNSSTTTQELVDAMVAIRGGGLSCSFPIPPDATFSPTNTTIEYESGIGPGQTLTQVLDAAACGADWYYDDNNNPTEVNLCPSTCATVQGDTDICNGPNEFLDPAVRTCYLYDAADTADWATASANCQAWGGELTSVTNNADRLFLAGQIGAQDFWTGGNRLMSASWLWAAGEPFSWTNWDSGQPNNSPPTQECIAAIAGDLWHDRDCSTAFHYVCQRPVAPKQVSLVLECPQLFSTTNYTEVYEASCPAGTTVQWGYLTYDSIAPLDTTIVFEARTAELVADLGAASYHTITTAQSSPTDTQVCGFGSGCEGDLYNGLGALPDAQLSVMELRATLNPTMDQSVSPELNSWQVTYSCPDYE